MVPKGIMIRLMADNTIPTMRAQGLKLKKSVTGDEAWQRKDAEEPRQRGPRNSQDGNGDGRVPGIGRGPHDAGHASHRHGEE